MRVEGGLLLWVSQSRCQLANYLYSCKKMTAIVWKRLEYHMQAYIDYQLQESTFLDKHGNYLSNNHDTAINKVSNVFHTGKGSTGESVHVFLRTMSIKVICYMVYICQNIWMSNTETHFIPNFHICNNCIKNKYSTINQFIFFI